MGAVVAVNAAVDAAVDAAGIDDLEALFDQVAAESAAARQDAPFAEASNDAASGAPAPGTEAGPEGEGGDMFHRVGQLTRTLHDALRELGYDRKLENAVQCIPDARDRLTYIATLTGQAADKALGAVERGQDVQSALADASTRLSSGWEKLYAGSLSVEEFKALAGETREFLASVPKQAGETKAQLHEIMMAQDFHDLTGQVINRVIALAQSLEGQLVKLLIDASPAEARQAGGGSEEWLTGPAMNAAERSDVVANQAQVDDLLESLGF